MEQNCNFSVPINLGTEEVPDWEYSSSSCSSTELYEYVENTTTLASFYLEKSFSYGDFFLMGFLTLFSLAVITKIIWQIFAKK